MEELLKKQLLWQKLQCLLLTALLVCLAAGGLFLISFGKRTAEFMEEAQGTLERVNATMEQSNEIMTQVSGFIALANEKLDTLDVEQLNGAVEETEKMMEKTNEMLTAMDGAVKDAEKSVKSFTDVLDNAKKRLESIGDIFKRN